MSLSSRRQGHRLRGSPRGADRAIVAPGVVEPWIRHPRPRRRQTRRAGCVAGGDVIGGHRSTSPLRGVAPVRALTAVVAHAGRRDGRRRSSGCAPVASASDDSDGPMSPAPVTHRSPADAIDRSPRRPFGQRCAHPTADGPANCGAAPGASHHSLLTITGPASGTPTGIASKHVVCRLAPSRPSSAPPKVARGPVVPRFPVTLPQMRAVVGSSSESRSRVAGCLPRPTMSLCFHPPAIKHFFCAQPVDKSLKSRLGGGPSGGQVFLRGGVERVTRSCHGPAGFSPPAVRIFTAEPRISMAAGRPP